MTALSAEQRTKLASAPAGRPKLARAIDATGEPKPTPAFGCDDRPSSVAEAQRMPQEPVAAVAPVLRGAAHALALAGGGPQEMTAAARLGGVVHERSS
jgi:hypothetical protein